MAKTIDSKEIDVVALKKMTITKEDVTSLDPKAEAKFATAAIAGRVLNARCETDGTGTAEIQLKHPDGTITKLADAAIPTLAKDEKMVLRARIAVSVSEPVAVVAEIE